MLRFGLMTVAWLLLLATPALAQGTASAIVERVVDGDTVEVRPAVPGTTSVRLIGVDTPETVDPSEDVQPFGPEASSFTTRRLEGERVTLVFDQDRVDDLGRALAYVRVGGSGEIFNETLLRGGYAQLEIVVPQRPLRGPIPPGPRPSEAGGTRHLGTPQGAAVPTRQQRKRDRRGIARLRAAAAASPTRADTRRGQGLRELPLPGRGAGRLRRRPERSQPPGRRRRRGGLRGLRLPTR